MVRRKRWIVLALIIGMSALIAYLVVRQAALADEFITNTQTTLNHFNPGQFERTGLATVGDTGVVSSGAVSLIALGVAGDWITDTGTNLPPMFGQGTVEHNWYIYTIGGNLGGGVATNTVYYARIITLTAMHSLSQFSTTTPLPSSIYQTGLYYHSTAVVGDFVYVIGGENSDGSTLYREVMFSQFDPNTGELGSWQTTESLPQPRLAAGVAVLSDTIYILGGQDDSWTATNTVYFAKPNTDGTITQWYTATGSLPEALYANMAATSGAFIYSMGGSTLVEGFWYGVYYAAPESNGDIPASGWITTTNLNNRVFRGAGLSVNGILFATGGNRGAFQPSDFVEASFLEDDGSVRFWADSPNIQPPRMAHGVVVDGDKFLYIIGGANETGVVPITTGIINIGRTAGQGARAYAPNGRYTSPPIQLGNINRILQNLRWSSWLPTGQVTMAVNYRYQAAGKDWSQWFGPFPSNSGADIQTTTLPISGTAWLFQYRADLDNTIGVTRSAIITTPFLLQVEIDYVIPSPPELVKRANPPDQLVAGAPGEVAPGELISYTIEMTGTSANGLPGTIITDVLPVGTSFVVGSDYVSATFPISPSVLGNVIAWDMGTFPPGIQTKAVLGYAARVNSDVQLGQLLTNTVIFRSDVNDPLLRATRHIVNAPIRVFKQQTSSAPPGSSGTVETGDRITYTVVLSNPNSAALTGAIITDSVPAGTSYVIGSIKLTPTLSGTVDESQQPLLRWNVPALGARDMVTAQFSVDVSATQLDTVISNQAVATTDQSFPHQSNSVSYFVVTPILLAKSANLPNGFLVPRGALITYTLIFTNPTGIAPPTSVVISDSVPANTTFVSCTGGCVQAGGTLNWTRTMVAREVGSVQLTVQVGPTAPAGAAIINVATLSSAQQHELSVSNPTTHTVVIAGTAGAISKSANPPGGLDVAQSVSPGTLITYTLTYTNYNATPLTNVVIQDPLPANTGFVSCTGGCTFNVGMVSWPSFSLPPGASGQVRLTVQVNPSAPDGATLQNQANMSSDQGQAASELVVHRVVIRYDLQLSKSNSVTATLPGSTFTYTLVYTNQGPLLLNGVVITDYLGFVPAGQASASPKPYLHIGSSTPGWVPIGGGAEGSIFRYSVGTLSPGQTGVVTMAVRLDNNVPYNVNLMDNRAVIADDGSHPGDVNPSNQVAEVTNPIQGPDLVISNARITGSTKPGMPFTVTATVTNRGLNNTLTWERLITETEPGNNWFAAELYVRPAAWQSGPPSGPHDHAGGYCSGQTSPCAQAEQRYSYLGWVAYQDGLTPGGSADVSWLVSVPTLEAYLVYVQVDTGFWLLSDPPYGRVLEFDELNNVAFAGIVGASNQVFLPLVLHR